MPMATAPATGRNVAAVAVLLVDLAEQARARLARTLQFRQLGRLRATGRIQRAAPLGDGILQCLQACDLLGLRPRGSFRFDGGR